MSRRQGIQIILGRGFDAKTNARVIFGVFRAEDIAFTAEFIAGALQAQEGRRVNERSDFGRESKKDFSGVRCRGSSGSLRACCSRQ